MKNLTNNSLRNGLQYAVGAMLCMVIAASCQKNGTSDIDLKSQKRTVIDYVLDHETMYLVKYKFQYNNKYQVTKVFRGERYAEDFQLQLIAENHYDPKNSTEFPDSVSTYNTKGFKSGVILAKDFTPVVKEEQGATYIWPTRSNKLLTVAGGKYALAVAGKQVDWAGSGHMGSGSTINMMHFLKYLNRPNLRDSIQLYVKHKTDGTKRNFDDFRIKFNPSGYPIDMGFYDAINADYEQLKINYREE